MLPRPSGPTRTVVATCLPIALLLFVGGWVSFNYRAFTYDDPWITYRVAENIIAGKGFVYNEGESVLVTTTPLYTLILASLGLFFRSVPALSLVIGAASYSGVPLLLLAIGKKANQPAAGLLAGLLYLLFPLMPLTLPMETPFLMLLATLLLYCAMSDRWKLAAGLLGLTVLTRPDAAVLAVVMFVYFVACHRRFPLQEGLVFLVVVAPWLAFSQLTFGSPFPNPA